MKLARLDQRSIMYRTAGAVKTRTLTESLNTEELVKQFCGTNRTTSRSVFAIPRCTLVSTQMNSIGRSRTCLRTGWEIDRHGLFMCG